MVPDGSDRGQACHHPQVDAQKKRNRNSTGKLVLAVSNTRTAAAYLLASHFLLHTVCEQALAGFIADIHNTLVRDVAHG